MARILLVTSDEALARMTLWILAEQRHDATSVSDTAKALDTFRVFPPDLVLLNGSGAKKTRDAALMYAALPGLQIIGLHEHSHAGIERHIRAEGHLHKPFHAEDLISLVNELVRSA
jgi:DNA-binding response OmpR family regulator